MIFITCVDDGMGLSFNGRRQSRDAVLCRDVLAQTGGKPLWIHSYSAPLFAEAFEQVRAADDLLDCAGEADYCFVERTDAAPYAARISALILYRWNRSYPADVRLTLDISQFTLVQAEEFAGSSHPVITRELWRKKTNG